MLFGWITIKWMVFLTWLSLGGLVSFLYLKLKKLIISDNHVLAGKLDNVLANQKKIIDAINAK